MLYEQVAPLSLILQQDFDQGKIDKQEFVEGLRFGHFYFQTKFKFLARYLGIA
jgi:hypothetical protein